MIFHEIFRVLWKSIISQEKHMFWRLLEIYEKINEKLIWTHKSGWFFTLIFIVPIRIASSFKKSVLYQIFEKIQKL